MQAKQERFCYLYALNDNATQSYIESYGCKYDTAKTNANRLLANADIKSRVASIKAEIQKQIEQKAQSKIMDKMEMQTRLSDIARDDETRQETVIKAIHELACMQGLMTQKLEMSGELVTTVEMVGDIDA